MADNSSSLSLLTVLKPGGSSHTGAESKPAKTIDQMIALMSDRGLGPIGTFVVLITVARPCGSRRVGLSFLSRGK